MIYVQNGIEQSHTYKFGEDIITEDFNFILHKTDQFKYPESTGKYYFTVNSKDALISYLQGKITVSPENITARTIRISLVDYNRYKARDLLMAVDTLYLDYTKQAKNQALEQKIKFLNSQILVTEDTLETYDSYFENFIIEHRTLNLMADIQRVIENLIKLDSAQHRLDSQLSEALEFNSNYDNYDSLLSESAVPAYQCL